MEARQRIDTIIDTVHRRIEEEIGGLIGTDLTLTLAEPQIISKGDLFDLLSGKLVFTRITIGGNSAGDAGLLISMKDAIRLGGALIMLPPSELHAVVESETFDEEIEDSCGEIGNIITGIFNNLFENYPVSCRFEREEQHTIDMAVTDVLTDQSIADIVYYKVSSAITLDKESLGELTMLLPAVFFGLAEETSDDLQEKVSPSGEDHQPLDAEHDIPAALDTREVQQETVDLDHTEPAPKEIDDEMDTPGPSTESVPDETDRSRADMGELLELCRVRIQEDISEIIGTNVSCSKMDNKVVTKEQFFLDETSGKQVVAVIDVAGDVTENSFLYLGLKDAIRVGGTLLMLSKGELDAAVSSSEFNQDTQDAYEEVTSVISKAYSDIFQEHYNKKSYQFAVHRIDQITPMKVDIKSDEPMIDQTYYLSSMVLGLEDRQFGRLQMLFPAAMFGLESVGPDIDEKRVDDQTDNTEIDDGQGSEGHQKDVPVPLKGESVSDSRNTILIISDVDPEANRIGEILEGQGISAHQLTFRDSVDNYLPGSFQAVVLVMSEVNEQSLGMAIKVSTCCSLPLIASGSKWTRSKVIQAVKYGVNDILLTPATDVDIRAKISSYAGMEGHNT